MARFRGTVQGTRGPASRLGHKSMHVTAQSWVADVHVSLFALGDEDRVTINISPRDNRLGRTLYHGKLNTLIDRTKTFWHTLDVLGDNPEYFGDAPEPLTCALRVLFEGKTREEIGLAVMAALPRE